MTYRERREARAERLAEWADKRAVKADADLTQAREMGAGIPFGQPVLSDHYSAGRDRSFRQRIRQTSERGWENLRKSEDMAGKAASIEAALKTSIYSDDPDAIEALETRIAGLEAKRDAMKTANAAYRKDHKAELAAMTPYQRAHAVPYPSYALANLSGSLSTQRRRLAQLKSAADATTLGDAS